jgi:UDP-glucuronate 4-epimerase
MRVFVTGTAGFIGLHLALRLLGDGHSVMGYDGLTSPYADLKQRRLDLLRGRKGFADVRGHLEDRKLLSDSIGDFGPDVIVHLAARAGVRHSIEHPQEYISSNLLGTFHLLEAAKAVRPKHLLVASSSSVYGGNRDAPYREESAADWPMSLYGATKKANEALSHSYSHLFGLPTTCFRFFTVYGPWGRPDMSPYKFVSAIERGDPIDVYGEGRMQRDFTYIDDLIEGIVRLMGTVPEQGRPVDVVDGQDSLSAVAPWRVVNIGGGQPVALLDYIAAIEEVTGKTAEKRLLPMQPGDVRDTHASPALLWALTGFVPATPLADGVRRYVEWYRADTAG